MTPSVDTTTTGTDWVRALAAAPDGVPQAGTAAWRQACLAHFEAVGFPTPRLEAWKYCNVARIADRAWRWAPVAASAAGAFAGLDAPLAIPGLRGVNLRLVDGRLLQGAVDEGPQVFEAHGLQEDDPATVERLEASAARSETNPFVALNGALLQGGVWLRVPAGVRVASPIHLQVIGPGVGGEGATGHVRILVDVEPGAEVEIVEEHVAVSENADFATSVTEIVLGDAARATYTLLQRAHDGAHRVSAAFARVGRDAHLKTHAITLGGALVRNDLEVQLAGEGATATLTGINVLRGSQLVDDHTRVLHLAPHGTSDEAYKAVLTDRARGVFDGEIRVAPGAQKTNSRQSSRNLLLSRQALMNTKPELKIYADDVKCSHGATIGQLDEDALFYLRSRGIPLQRAQEILKHAFLGDVVERIDNVELRAFVEGLLQAALQRLQVK